MDNSDLVLKNLADYFAKIAQTSVANFVSEITITQPQISQASQSYEYIKSVLTGKSDEEEIPLLANSPFFLTGSYKRKTKISPLNDIDIFMVLNARDTTHSNGVISYSPSSPLAPYSTDGRTISSIKILNTIKDALGQTYTSKIIRDQQAVSIYLSSYDINIDIVPAIGIRESEDYLIPYGEGLSFWKYSNPKKDEELLNQLDGSNGGFLKPAIKIIKYWNREHNSSRFQSYHLEAAAHHIFSSRIVPVSSIQEACQVYFSNLYNYLYNCPDPTGLSGPISGYLPEDWTTRLLYLLKIGEAQEASRKDSASFISYMRGE